MNATRDPAQSARLDEVLYNLCECCRVLAVLLNPFLPETSAKFYGQLGLKDSPEKFSEAAWGKLQRTENARLTYSLSIAAARKNIRLAHVILFPAIC